MYSFAFFFLFRGPGLFAAPPLDGQVVLAGRSPDQTALEARNKVLLAAESYRGTPYRYGGLDRGGLDCSGLVYISFKDSLAVSVPRSTSALYGWTEKINADALQPGDLVFFITQGRNISHVGIYAGEGRFIHSASEGPETGVIYSRLSENYWRKSFAGAGRALPQISSGGELPAGAPGPVETAAGARPPESRGAGETAAGARPAESRGAVKPAAAESPSSAGKERGGAFAGKGFMLGLGFAPSWNSLTDRNNPLRGVSVQGRFAWKGHGVGLKFIPGFEIRPEYDDALGVFRMAFTPSLGFDDKLRIFAGPAFTLGSPAIETKSGNRSYAGGNAWIGAAGVTVAPFSISIGKGKLDPFAELAWQSYHRSGGTDVNRNADVTAGLRFSTGIRYTWDL
jgi:probable lipoprotein NlpC